MASVYAGQNLLIECEFRLNGVPTDPTVVTVAYRTPSGTQSTLTYPNSNLVRRSDGLFEASVPAEEAGTWAFRAEGVGVVDAVNEFTMTVLESGLSG
jgi:hypothetical protein